jgi:hypothetical protein
MQKLAAENIGLDWSRVEQTAKNRGLTTEQVIKIIEAKKAQGGG